MITSHDAIKTRWPMLKHVDHPLIQHKLSLMRDVKTSTIEFRNLLKEISMLMGYEVTHDLPLRHAEIETPMEHMRAPFMDGLKPAIIPILRAGLGMSDGLIELIPGARIGHIGLFRDHDTKLPQQYFVKLPALEERLVILCDPMLATGHSAAYAVKLLIEHGAQPVNIRFMSLLAAPEGLDAFFDACPDVKLFTAAIDRCLNDNAYIMPGLGDAGDRLFGTK